MVRVARYPAAQERGFDIDSVRKGALQALATAKREHQEDGISCVTRISVGHVHYVVSGMAIVHVRHTRDEGRPLCHRGPTRRMSPAAVAQLAGSAPPNTVMAFTIAGWSHPSSAYCSHTTNG